ncbi:MAG: TIGR03118 family protein, partial [Acidobacteriota bacterium]|nr:TIGR03118 family protein [Acidobacteriota bacterium]
MLRRHFAKHKLESLTILLLLGVFACFILAGVPTSAKLAHTRDARPQDFQRSAPENFSTTMYGGNGGHSNSDSINDGSLVIVDQANGSTTLVGHPNGVARLTGLAFDSTGKLFGSTTTAGGFPPPPPPMTSTLVTINPANGALVSTVGTITDGSGGPAISIADLSVQPGTDTLYGVRGPGDGGGGQGKLYTINKGTAVATLVGNTNAFFATIAFAPDGTLYESAADLNFMTGDEINKRFMKVNPSNGAIIINVGTSVFYGALDVRPTDSVIFGGTGDAHQIFTINANTGAATLVGDTGQNFVGDLAFSPIANVGINAYRQTNLVSDIPAVGQILDPSLVNPWGIAMSATSPFWVSDAGAGVSTLYGGDVGGNPLFKNTLTVKIPGGDNTGVVFNGSSDFVINDGNGSGPARFMFATENGTIAAWRAGTTAITVITTPNAVYKGLAIGSAGGPNFIYAANFKNGSIDVFGTSFTLINFGPGSFADPTIPAGYAPFNVQNLGGKIFVTYALQDADKKDDVPGPGHGYVNVFTTNGVFLGRLISAGALNSPWGLALSPVNFGLFGNALLVGNFGDGKINAYNPNGGALLGTLNDQSGHELEIDGLWALTFGNGVGGGDPNQLYFSAGIGDESHGIFGKLQAAVPAPVLLQLS